MTATAKATRKYLRARALRGGGLVGYVIVAVTLVAVVAPTPGSSATLHHRSTRVGVGTSVAGSVAPTISGRASSQINIVYPAGTPDVSSISGESPPGSAAMPGYSQSYVNDFTGTALPVGWEVFTGRPSGDPGAQWGSAHVVVSDGLLRLNTYQDPAFSGEWVAGGLCQCGVTKVYGAYFVRSKMTGPGPTQVELLWPVTGWPPEIDFNETYGGTTSSMATDHFTGANLQIQRTSTIDMTKWHTWGVVWTPTQITYTVDGRAWGSVSGPTTIPSQPMTLNLQQQTWCASGWACPTTSQSTLVDWVAEYTIDPHVAATVGPFSPGAVGLTPSLRAQTAAIAQQMWASGNSRVSLIGSGDSLVPSAKNIRIGRNRARSVERFLKQRLARLGITRTSISISSSSALARATRDVVSTTSPPVRSVTVSIN